MKKSLTIGLLTLGISGAAHAQSVFTNVDGNLWKTDANWSANEPTSSVDASVTAGHNAVIDTGDTANAKKLTMNGTGTTGSSLTIQANGSLTLSDKLLLGRYSTVTNNGTLTINTVIGMNSPGTQFFNSGTITATNLLIKNNGVFNMEDGGSFMSTGKLLVSGDSETTTKGILNIHGGTTKFIDTDWFDSTAVGFDLGDYTIDFDNTGTLTFDLSADATNRYNDLKGIIGSAITDGWITTDGVKFADGGGATLAYNDTAKTITLTAVPEPGTYALLSGCLGLASVILRRRRS